VKVARVATAAFQLTLGAYTLVAKLATLATARFGGAARASASAAAAGEAASKAYAAALGTWTASSTAATASASTLTGKLGKLGGLLGKAGILGAVGLIGYEFGTWLDKTTGISERIAKWLADLTGVNDELHKADRLAKERTGQPVAPVQETSIGARFLDALAAGASGGMHAGGFGSHGSFQAPQVVTSSSSSTSNEKVEVTIKDETGRAEVKRKAPPSGSRVKVTPSGRF
jgi:hypothetical protein